MKIQSFNEIIYIDYAVQIASQIAREIEGKDKEYILGVIEDDYKKYLIDKYSLVPVEINYDSCFIDKPTVSKKTGRTDFGDRYQYDVYTFTLTYQYSGSIDVFRIHPSSRSMISTILGVDHGTVSFSFEINKLDPKEFEGMKNRNIDKAFCNLENANKDVVMINREIVNATNTYFTTTKAKYEKENNFFEAINLSVNRSSVFTAPTIQKKIIPQPTVSKGKQFSSEPTMTKEIYDDILQVIYSSGKTMETKPSLYQKKDEESLRDQFLFVLESRYESTTATGETFNHNGRADILLKYAKDSSNLFVAECKLWYGASEFINGISQLFDRYLTWRDSKTALLLFVKNKDFSNVLFTIKDEVKKHPYFVRENGLRGDSSFSYIFRLPQDPQKEVLFEIIAFHFYS
jgi:hypothetical protein